MAESVIQNPIFEEFFSGAESYHNFRLCYSKDTQTATDTSSVRIVYRKLDPFRVKLPDSFFATEEDLDKSQVEAAVVRFLKESK